MVLGWVVALLWGVCVASIAASPDFAPAPASFEETPPPQIEWSQELISPEAPNPERDNKQNIDLGKVASAMQAERSSESGAAPISERRSTSQAREISYLKAAAALLFVLGLVVVSGYFAKKFSPHSKLLRGVSLADVLGRIYLSPRASLHFVRTGGRVLVIGVTPTQINLVAEFDAAAFEETENVTAEEQEGAEEKRSRFAQLLTMIRSRAEDKKQAEEQAAILPDDSLKALREEIVRLQHYVKEMSRSETKM